jgi:hypothetical protein
VVFIAGVNRGREGGLIGWLRIRVEAFLGSLAGPKLGARPSISTIF